MAITLPLDSNGNPIQADTIVVVSSEFTRPNTTPAMAAKSIVNENGKTDARLLAAAARTKAGSGEIIGLQLVNEDTTTGILYRVWFFNSMPTGNFTDGTTYQLSYSNNATRLGYVDLVPQPEAAGSTAQVAFNNDLLIPFVTAADSKDLYYLIEAISPYTPATGSKKIFLQTTIRQHT